MGLLNFLTGMKKILSYEILFDQNNKVTVNTTKEVSTVLTPEYIRLWAFYQAKIIYNLGYPNNLSAILALESLAKIVKKDIDSNTNCFKRAGFDDIIQLIQYSDDISSPITKFNGEFFAKGSVNRSIKTHFPMQGTEQDVVYSGIALMQYCININEDDKYALGILTKTARNLFALYEAGMGGGISDIVQIPQTAYLEAIGTLPEE
jgi:hypothetical protein